MEWQDFSTAPKDGSSIIALGKDQKTGTLCLGKLKWVKSMFHSDGYFSREHPIFGCHHDKDFVLWIPFPELPEYAQKNHDLCT